MDVLICRVLPQKALYHHLGAFEVKGTVALEERVGGRDVDGGRVETVEEQVHEGLVLRVTLRTGLVDEVFCRGLDKILCAAAADEVTEPVSRWCCMPSWRLRLSIFLRFWPAMTCDLEGLDTLDEVALMPDLDLV